MSVEEAIKVIIGERLNYFGRVGINIDRIYGIIATRDGQFQIRRMGSNEEYAIHINIPDVLKKAIARVLGKPFNLKDILYMLLGNLKDITIVIGGPRDI